MFGVCVTKDRWAKEGAKLRNYLIIFGLSGELRPSMVLTEFQINPIPLVGGSLSMVILWLCALSVDFHMIMLFLYPAYSGDISRFGF